MNEDMKRMVRENEETCWERGMFIAWYDLDYEIHVFLSFNWLLIWAGCHYYHLYFHQLCDFNRTSVYFHIQKGMVPQTGQWDILIDRFVETHLFQVNLQLHAFLFFLVRTEQRTNTKTGLLILYTQLAYIDRWLALGCWYNLLMRPVLLIIWIKITWSSRISTFSTIFKFLFFVQKNKSALLRNIINLKIQSTAHLLEWKTQTPYSPKWLGS